jgi:hypothetical protein
VCFQISKSPLELLGLSTTPKTNMWDAACKPGFFRLLFTQISVNSVYMFHNIVLSIWNCTKTFLDLQVVKMKNMCSYLLI